MKKIIQFPVRKTPEQEAQEAREKRIEQMKANKKFDYTELQDRIFDRYDIDTFASEMGKTALEFWDCVHETYDSFTLADIERMKDLLDIPDDEVSRVFFKPYAR